MKPGTVKGVKAMPGRVMISFLAGLYPALFFLSNNWHIFSFSQGVILLVGASLISSIILLTASFLFDIIARSALKGWPDRKGLPEGQSSFFDPILAFLSILLCIYLLRNTLASIQNLKIVLYCFIGLLTVYFTWRSYKSGINQLIMSMAVLSGLAALGLISNAYMQSRSPIEDWTTVNKSIYDQIKFKKGNNVYLIVSEAYSSKGALKDVYNIDNNRFYEELEEKGFRINHNYFSNYHHTLASLPSLFGMEHHYGLINIGNFDSVGGRRLLEGAVYNPVIDIFRSNNYRIQYLHNVSTLIPNGASVDYCIPSLLPVFGLKIFLNDQDITEPYMSEDDRIKNLLDIKNRITFSSHQEEPFFSFIYLSFPGHSPSRLKANTKAAINKALENFRGIYHQKIDDANEKLIDLIKHIIINDPESIIVLIGDHGSWGFRLKEDGNGTQISNQLFILDRFGVLAGIRGPEELSSLMENKTIKSHINIFTYLFFYLSHDDKILQTLSFDDSYEAAYLLAIKNGEILDNFTKVAPPEKISDHQL